MKVIEFRNATLGDVCDEIGGLIQTGPFGSQLHQSDYSEHGIPVVMPKDIVEGRVSVETVARVHPSHAERLSRHKLKAGDIIYGRRGDIGRQALIRADQAGWMCGTGCLRISLGAQLLDPLFLHYYLRQDEVVTWITNQAVGATMPNLNTEILRSVPVRFPPLPIQRRIAGILSTYDDLIENSQRRIKILEEMARRLYREWFVHFRFPGHEGCMLVESPLGEIPEGWEVKRAPECIDFNPRVTVPRDGEKPFVPMGCLSNDSMVISDIQSRGGNSGSKFQNGDTLFARITPCIENGKTGFVQFLPSPDAAAFGSTEFIILRSRTLTPEVVYLVSRSDEFRSTAIKSMSGATGRQRVQEQCFDDYLLVQPTPELLDQFTSIVSPVFRLIQSLHFQIQNLRRTRDLLLPRLLSGQIDLERLPERTAIEP